MKNLAVICHFIFANGPVPTTYWTNVSNQIFAIEFLQNAGSFAKFVKIKSRENYCLYRIYTPIQAPTYIDMHLFRCVPNIQGSEVFL